MIGIKYRILFSGSPGPALRPSHSLQQIPPGRWRPPPAATHLPTYLRRLPDEIPASYSSISFKLNGRAFFRCGFDATTTMGIWGTFTKRLSSSRLIARPYSRWDTLELWNRQAMRPIFYVFETVEDPKGMEACLDALGAFVFYAVEVHMIQYAYRYRLSSTLSGIYANRQVPGSCARRAMSVGVLRRGLSYATQHVLNPANGSLEC